MRELPKLPWRIKCLTPLTTQASPNIQYLKSSCNLTLASVHIEKFCVFFFLLARGRLRRVFEKCCPVTSFLVCPRLNKSRSLTLSSYITLASSVVIWGALLWTVSRFSTCFFTVVKAGSSTAAEPCPCGAEDKVILCGFCVMLLPVTPSARHAFPAVVWCCS